MTVAMTTTIFTGQARGTEAMQRRRRVPRTRVARTVAGCAAAGRVRAASYAAAIIGVVAFVSAAVPVLAQTKIAYVASETILDRMPEAQTARATLSELQASWMRDIKRQQSAIEALQQEIETNRLLWSTQEKRDANARLKDLQSKLLQFQTEKFGPDGEYEKQHEQLMGPLMDRVIKAIGEEAQAQGYDFVFDKSTRGMPMLYANTDNDLTYAVLKRLGVKLEPSEEQKAAAKPQDNADEARSRRGQRTRGDEPPPKEDPNAILPDHDGSDSAKP